MKSTLVGPCIAVLAIVLAGAAHCHAQKIDLNANGRSDLWELICGADNLNANDDSDGDGVSNTLESTAGTNPFDTGSALKLDAVAHTAATISVTLCGFPGKRYQLLSSPDLVSAGVSNWVTAASVLAQTGTVVTLSAPVGGASGFFCIAVADVDTDSDGVNDWEEYKLRTDPTRDWSNNQLDSHGQPMSDYAYAVWKLASQSVGIMIDRNGNEMSDIWELMFDAGNLSPSADTDGDGVANALESTAGTDPLDPASAARIATAVHSVTNFTVTMPCALGKQYQLQSVAELGPASASNWVTEASVAARTGTIVTLSAPAIGTSKFLRIAIADLDTDGDGVSDWEEYELGLDPAKAASNSQLDGNGQPMNDYVYSVSQLASQNVVTIVATDPTAIQPDAGQNAVNSGLVTLSRGGFPLTAFTANLTLAGPGPGVATEGLDHAVVPRTVHFPAGASSQSMTVTPLANTNLLLPVIATLKLLPGSGYQQGAPGNASVVIYPSATPGGTGLTGQYYTNSSATYSSSANFNPANLKLTRVDPTIDFTWGNTTNPIPNNGYYCVRWTGQVQPQYSETYYFVANTGDGVKLWVNDQLIVNVWSSRNAADSVGTIDLQAGVRYNIRMEYFQLTGTASARLSWYSPSQAKQIIPASRLYPTTNAPSAVVSPITAVAFVGIPFNYTNVGANSASSYSASGLPPGLGFNSTNGVISGIPTLAGDYQVTLTAGNSAGLGSSVVAIQVLDTGSAVTREVWTSVSGVNVADIPLNTPATLTNSLGTLEGITDFGDNYGERVRGYLTAPVTGNYYFWLAAGDSAELWISSDSEPVNKVRRAYVLSSAPTAPRQWNLQPNQRSPWLALVAGQRYYLEILHKAGAGTNDNWSVAWLQDPTGTNDVPNEVIPGYVLSRFFPVPPTYQPGTLYSATMLAQAGAVSSGVGSATLRVSPDESHAVLKFTYNNLTAPITGQHIHSEPYLGKPGQIMFDIDTTPQQSDGSYLWTIAPVGALSAGEIREIIKEGKAYINLHTANYPGGEINGHFTLANGTQTFTPPPDPPAWSDDSSNSNAAARFLIQATYGPSAAEIANVQALGYSGWIDYQTSLPSTHHLPHVLDRVSADPSVPYPSALTFNAWWHRSVTAPDQLRQRVAFALSEIMVVSENGVLRNNARALSSYYDTLLDNAFGNFRDLLEAVTLAPAMGLYLDMRANSKGSLITGLHPNENYAREILQLFSIGLYRMWPDGSLVLSSGDTLVPTYDQDVIMGFASVFTGWNYYQPNQANGRLPTTWSVPANYTNPMVLVPSRHELGAKRLLENVVLPPAWGAQADSTKTNFDYYCSQDLEHALDSIFHHQNVGPFICRQLIQRLVTSHPSRDYLYRVAQRFNDNGSGVRGDLGAVIRAILLDYEARSPGFITQPTFGKQREPLLRVTAPARAFPSPPGLGGTYDQSGTQHITVTTTAAHRLNNNDVVLLDFTDTSGQPAPPTQGYTVTVTSLTNFTVNAPNLLSGTYTQSANVITLSLASHGLQAADPVYLVCTTGGGASGQYQVEAVISTSSFKVNAADSATRSGSGLIHRIQAGGYIQSGTNITVSCSSQHGLSVGEAVLLKFSTGTAPPGVYQVAAVPDPTRFAVVATNSASQTRGGFNAYPLSPPPLTRAGLLGLQQSTWNLGNTDANLTQTPLRSPTVFNYFFPDYKFPGVLAAAGLTTPEFQLTSDTEVAVQMNFLANGILNNGNNTNGLSSFTSGDGDIVLDIGPWMTTNYTATAAGVGNLVDSLSALLTGGQVSAAARTAIVNYVASPSLAYSTPPTSTQIRNRVRAAVHLLLTSPDFTIQK
ncbi:MAG TPA: DUF1800 family protein [Candidatus Paceibacterota bacterium]|nr:DUF1800 family protein [Verrucomicrobiota bacterium]HSA11709.1 DUF1800 family protein [Candidatus Paceibacterota bacterium]